MEVVSNRYGLLQSKFNIPLFIDQRIQTMDNTPAILRAGFPYLKTLGMRRVTSGAVDIAIGNEGRLYILCRGHGSVSQKILRYTFDDKELGSIGGPGTEEGNFLWPSSLIIDSQENLCVSDEFCHRISFFSKDGEFLSCWGEPGKGDGQLDRPSSIAFDKSENLYVSDTLNHRIQMFTKDGQFLKNWGCKGNGDGEFNMPWGLATDESENVYVADWRNNRIQKFTADGEFILKFGSAGTDNGKFNQPSGVEIDKDGDIYVADWGNNRVQWFNSEGRYVDKFIGDATLSKSALEYVMANAVTLRLRDESLLEPQKRLRGPISVRVDTQGIMYIVDHGSHRVQLYQKESYRLGAKDIAPISRSPTLMVT